MKQQFSRGFTLIEVMIVVAIVAIIAAVALPSYQTHVQTTRRGAATGCLLEMAQQMERGYTTSLSYGPTSTLPSVACTSSIAAEYSFEFSGGASQTTTYAIQATPIGSQASDPCGTLEIDHKTVKKAAGSQAAADVKRCWK
jgi:type IV pilus assembly protein PilE